VRRLQAPPALEHARLKDPRHLASLMHAYIVVGLMAGVRPEEALATGLEEDVDLTTPDSIADLYRWVGSVDAVACTACVTHSRRSANYTWTSAARA
jgi:hypothetical protein